ncbi:MAG: chromate efflux transporter [Brevundimonas sp.]|uniref:chromate efflux transporter n=1 Tax=Brevundimonas sp. TaxID=1871086 RepID=UPI002728022A|nr:chromate efflux transporter [Brevundimonas sp.]MDO9587336.1 chromate efflux transporter [Brevundimonas sp.]MDP3370127.1 chromate efflux transporter [Brevundimonas sp.]
MIDAAEPRPPDLSYAALFLRFLRFGLMAFGGPVAQIAMVRRELVEREGWISGPRFNRLLAVMQALPGPEAHELCVHLGVRARGRLGGLLAGLGFMLPGFILMLLAAWAYARFDIDHGWAAAGLLGAQAAVVALIIRATHHIGAHILIDRALWLIGAAAAAATLAAVPFWIVLPAGAGVYALVRTGRRGAALVLLAAAAAAGLVWVMTREAAGAGPTTGGVMPDQAAAWPGLLLSGLKAGLLTFGGAYTAIPFLRQDLVGRGWLDDGTFLDGVAVANVLPAPLIIFATFAGYAAGGLGGAVAMTAGVFLPAFAFSMVFYDRLETIVSEPRVRAALDGVAAAVVGVIAATAVSLAAGLHDPARGMIAPFAIAAAALLALYVVKSRYVPPVVILLAGLAGLALAAA